MTSSADWKLDPAELSSLFNSKTKAIIFNNPNNPLGKVYKRDEIEMICDLCKKHDVLFISDDVYEHMVRYVIQLEKPLVPELDGVYFGGLSNVHAGV